MTTLRQVSPALNDMLISLGLDSDLRTLLERFGANYAYMTDDFARLRELLPPEVKEAFVSHFAIDLGVLPNENGQIVVCAPSPQENINYNLC